MALTVIAAGCGDPAARVRLTPLGGACGRPMGGNLVRVTAYTASGERRQTLGLDETLAIADFPADTEQIGVEVLIGDGETGAAGKSAPLVFDALADGATIPVFMAPLDGFCEVGALTEPRAQPLIARAGDGVLVVGGVGTAGPLSTAEYYDPATATFSPVAVPQALTEDMLGFTGAALATLPDGRAALIGGSQRAFVVFDSKTRAFADPALIDPWAFHAAIATGDQEVLVAGGCTAITAGQCGGLPRRQMLRYQLTRLGVPDPSALLPSTGNLRIGAQLFDLGVQLDGRRQFLLAGGSGAPGLSDRFALDDDATTTLPGGHAQPVALDGGAVLAAFGDDAPATDDSGAAAVYAPDAPAAQQVANAPTDKFVRLIALEDGRVAGFGGDPMHDDPIGRVLIYDPTRDAWDVQVPRSPDKTGPLVAPSLARLADGTVLVTGGSVSAKAWLYRPSLVGPASGSITAAPASENSRGVLTAPDPATVTRTAAPPLWLLTAPSDALTARALVGGPRTATGSVRAIVHVRRGGVALIAHQTAPGQAIVARLVPDQPPRLVRLEAGVEHPVCSVPPVLAGFDSETAVTLRFSISDRAARLSINDREVLACDLVATERGAWGIAPLGAGAQLEVDSVTVAR